MRCCACLSSLLHNKPLLYFFLFSLEVLIRLALAKDQGTQEHAVEAIAELVTIPAIQVLTLKRNTVTIKQCLFPEIMLLGQLY